MTGDTIFALATAVGRAGVAVIRVSGPAAGGALETLTGGALPPPRQAARARFRDPASGAALEDGLCLWFPAPASFTGEDVAEFHIHGGRAGIDALCTALAGLSGLRMAEAGEFTRRAFENGKMDLTEVEALADLVNAETDAQRRQALRQLDGELGALYDDWRQRLIRVLAHLEADIDFPEDGLEDHIASGITQDIEGLTHDLSQYLDDRRRGERLRVGFYITILGPPNAGKSSLLNALARRPAAIVAETAGTTRDVIEVHLDLGGYPVIAADTAGLRDAGDSVEQEGVRRALARAEAADLKLVVIDASAGAPDSAVTSLLDRDAIAVINKIDLIAPGIIPDIVGTVETAPISAIDGTGLPELLQAIEARVADQLAERGLPAPTRPRHRAGLEECRDALDRALALSRRRTKANSGTEMIAEDVRLAVRALGRITGRVDVEDVLDVVFRDFCIGK